MSRKALSSEEKAIRRKTRQKIGEKIKKAIDESEYTSEEIASMMNVAKGTMRSYCNGNRGMNYKKAKHFSEITGVPITEICLDKEATKLASDFDKFIKTMENEAEFLRVLLKRYDLWRVRYGIE